MLICLRLNEVKCLDYVPIIHQLVVYVIHEGNILSTVITIWNNNIQTINVDSHFSHEIYNNKHPRFQMCLDIVYVNILIGKAL